MRNKQKIKQANLDAKQMHSASVHRRKVNCQTISREAKPSKFVAIYFVVRSHNASHNPSHNPSSLAGHSVLKTAGGMKECSVDRKKRRKSHSVILSAMF